MNKVIRVGIYIRVSTEEQAKHGYSLDSQKERLEAYSKEKGYQIYKIYADEGKSARSHFTARKELLKLLDAVKEHKIDRIVFWRLDRWFRNIQDYYKVQEILDKNNVDWECSDEEYNTTTANGRLYLNIKLSIAQNESDQTGDRIRFNFENMVKNKKAIFGNKGMPPGYMVTGPKGNKYVVKNPDEIELTNDMFDKLESMKSIRQVLVYINEKYNKEYLYSNFKKHFKNTLYIGKYRDIDGYCEPYLTIDRWNKIQKILKDRNVKVYNKKNTYIFSGLLRCPICNSKLVGCHYNRIIQGVNKNYKHYRCGQHFTNNLCPNKTHIPEEYIEKWLKDNFIKELNNYVIEIKNIELKEEVKNIDKKKLKEKLKRLDELYLNLKITKERYDKEYSLIKEQLGEEPTKKDVKKYDGLLSTLKPLELYEKLDDKHKCSFWKEYIDYMIQTEDGFKIFWL